MDESREALPAPPLLACLLVALLTRVVIVSLLRVPGIDEALMHGYGHSWLRTGEYLGPQWPVTWPLVSALLGRLVGGLLAVQLIFVAGGVATTWLAHRLVLRTSGSVAAGWSALLVAVLPAAGATIAKSGSHSIFLPLLVGGMLLHASCLEKPLAKRFVGLGAVLGLAYVTRSDGIVVLGLVTASLLVGSAPLRARTRRVLLVAAGALPLIAGNVAHIHASTGKVALSAHVGAMVEEPFFLDASPPAALVAAEEQMRSDSGGGPLKLLRHPRYLFMKVAYNVRLALRDIADIYLLPAPLLVLLGAGLAAGRRIEDARLGWLVLVWSIPFLAYLLLNVEARYFSPPAVFATLLAGPALVRLANLGRRAGLVAGVALVPFLAALSGMVALSARGLEDRALPALAEAARSELGESLEDAFVPSAELRFLIDDGAALTLPLGADRRPALLILDAAHEEEDRVSLERLGLPSDLPATAVPGADRLLLAHVPRE